MDSSSRLFLVRARSALWGLLALFALGCVWSVDESAFLTDEERQKITELVLSVAEDPTVPLDPAKAELWSLLGKYGRPPRLRLDRLQTQFIRIGEGHHLFWEDARQAVRDRRAVKSPLRAQWEEELLKAGWVSKKQLDRFDELMNTLANEEPMTANHGVELALSQEMVDEISKSWNAREFQEAVSNLLTPPQ